MLEHKLKDTILTRVDSDVVDNLIRKSDRPVANLSPSDRAILTELFSKAAAKVENARFTVKFEALGADADPVVLTQDEYMRRMKEMAAMQPGMNFYGELPDSYTIVVNTDNALVDSVRDRSAAALEGTVVPLLNQIDNANAEAEKARKDAGENELTAEARQIVEKADKAVGECRTEISKAIDAYAPSAPVAGQLVDLALLANGLLRGANLSAFIARSIELMKK